jgi:hypothetical protein
LQDNVVRNKLSAAQGIALNLPDAPFSGNAPIAAVEAWKSGDSLPVAVANLQARREADFTNPVGK